MTHDEAAAGLLQHLTDTHLADRARLGEVVAFDELVRRHADVVGRFAAVVTADGDLVPEITVRAFTDLFDQIGCGGYSIDDPFLPGLLRSTRALARIAVGAAAAGNAPRPRPPAGAEAYDDLTGAAVWRLDEPERSVRWLEGVLGMDEQDLVLTLDLDEVEVAILAARSAHQLGARHAAAEGLLASIAVDLPPETAERARATWRRWVATVADLPDLDEGRGTRSLLTRLEPITTKILRGAAVLLLVVGGAGIVFDGDGSGPGAGRAGAEERASSRGGDDRAEGSSGSIDAADAGDESGDGASAARGDGGRGTGGTARSTNRAGSAGASTDGSGRTGAAPTGGTAGPTGPSGAGPTVTGSEPGTPSVTPTPATPPAATPAPTRPTPGEPATPPPSPTPPATSPPPANPAPTPPPAPNPPPAGTPTTPIAPVVEIVTGVVGVIPPSVGGLGALGGN